MSLKTLALELEARGLTTPGPPKRPSRPIYANQLHKLFRNTYYKGDVQFQGVSYQGRHQALVSPMIWQKVQDVMASHVIGEKVRRHQHYLNGTIYRGKCHSHLGVQMSTNRQDVTYEYLVCSGRHDHRTGCEQRAMPIDVVEDRVADLYKTIQLGSVLRSEVETDLVELLSTATEDARLVRKALTSQQVRPPTEAPLTMFGAGSIRPSSVASSSPTSELTGNSGRPWRASRRLGPTDNRGQKRNPSQEILLVGVRKQHFWWTLGDLNP